MVSEPSRESRTESLDVISNLKVLGLPRGIRGMAAFDLFKFLSSGHCAKVVAVLKNFGASFFILFFF